MTDDDIRYLIEGLRSPDVDLRALNLQLLCHSEHPLAQAFWVHLCEALTEEMGKALRHEPSALDGGNEWTIMDDLMAFITKEITP